MQWTKSVTLPVVIVELSALERYLNVCYKQLPKTPMNMKLIC